MPSRHHATVPAPDTKSRILDAAEVLFAERGYDAASLRALTEQAGVNLAAVHYHFGSKQSLFAAVIERRVGALNAERLRAMDAAEAAAGEERPLPLETLLEAFFGPPLRATVWSDPGYAHFLRILGRMNSATGEHVVALRDVFHEVQARFLPALLATLPHLTEPDLLWRMHFLIGAMSTLFADPRRIKLISDGRCDSEDPDETLRQLVTFAAGALRAPAAGSPANASVGQEGAR